MLDQQLIDRVRHAEYHVDVDAVATSIVRRWNLERRRQDLPALGDPRPVVCGR